MMSKPMIFPWINRRELERVYQELYSGSGVKQKHALGRVGVWKSRAVHKLPVAVESTAAFVSAQLEGGRAGASRADQRRLRSIYSFALMRFVNHITENRQSTTFAQPIHKLAAEMGVPEWVVGLRHEAAHGELPSLSVLKLATQWCLHWLQREFWEVQVFGLVEQPDQGLREAAKVRDILVAYQQDRHRTLSERNYPGDRNINRDVERILLDNRCVVCVALAEEGYLVPSASQLTFLGITQQELSDGDLLLPDPVVQFWRPLLRRLAEHGLLLGLLYQLLAQVSEAASLGNKLLLSWVYTLLKGNMQAKKSRTCLFQERTVLPCQQLLSLCAQKPNPFSAQLLELLLDQVDEKELNADKKAAFRQLMAVYFNQSTDSDAMAECGELRTVEDLRKTTEAIVGRWSRCTEFVDWSDCALGLLPNQVLNYRTLELSKVEEEEEDSDTEFMCDDGSRHTTRPKTQWDLTEQVGINQWGEATVESITDDVLIEVVGV